MSASTSKPGEHVEKMQEIYGEGNSTVPGLLIDDEPVHGSVAILPRLEKIAAEPTLYPSEEAREAELWGDRELQDLGRRLPWGALHFRPEALGTFNGGEPLDGPGTDFAIRYTHGSWLYHKISAARLHDDLAGLPAKLAHVEELCGPRHPRRSAAHCRRAADRLDDPRAVDGRRPAPAAGWQRRGTQRA